LRITLGGDVVSKGAIIMVDLVSTVAETADTVTLLEVLGDFASYFFNYTSVVTTNLGGDVRELPRL
jgi:hypothetical protein